MMQIALIAALDENNVIGYQNQLPWHLPDDLKYFKKLTLHQTILMGRKTFLSIGKALPKRRNLVLTTQRDGNWQIEHIDNIEVFHDLESVLALPLERLMVIGGKDVFQQTLPLANRLYLTLVKAKVKGDTFFPDYDKTQWQEIEHIEHPADTKHDYAFSFVTLERKE